MKATLFSSLLGLALLCACGPKTETTPPDTAPKGETNVSTGAPQSAPAATNTETAAETPSSSATDTNEVAIIHTTEGDMVIEFWPDVAPKTVASFKNLAKTNAYNGTIFHRVVDGFMIQGGDLISKDPAKEAQYGSGDPGFTLPAEFSDKRHIRGVVSMARLGHDINSASSQFFIVLGDASFLDGQYTAFGKLIKGDDTLTKIGKVPVRMAGGERSKPTKRIEITSVEIVPREKVQ